MLFRFLALYVLLVPSFIILLFYVYLDHLTSVLVSFGQDRCHSVIMLFMLLLLALYICWFSIIDSILGGSRPTLLYTL
jgi:hypothetical protein